MRHSLTLILTLAVVSAHVGALAAGAPSALTDLKLFSNTQLGKGLWRVELISSNDPLIAKGADTMGKVGLCMDVAERLSKDSELDEAQCKPTVLKNTTDLAEVEVACSDGQRSHLTVKRETDNSYLINSSSTGADNKQRQISARYRYEGVCQGDSVIQMDKNSAACKMMGQVDMSKLQAMCANAPEAYRAQCEQQFKSVAGSCQ